MNISAPETSGIARRFRHRYGSSVVLLFVLGLSSCNDFEALPRGVFVEPVALTFLDGQRLKALDTKPLVVGERVTVAAQSGAANALSRTDVVLRDTTLLDIDGAGVVRAIAAGSSWLVWKTANKSADSTQITITSAGQPARDSAGWALPAPPEKTVDVRYPTGRSRSSIIQRSLRVAAGGDLQGALDAAQPGDEIVLASGATFVGNYFLPAKSSSTDWIVVRAEVTPVAAGTRVTPDDVLNSAKIITPNGDPAIKAQPGARKWRLVGFEVAHMQGGGYNYGIIILGRGDEQTLTLQPSEIILDRMYVHGSLSDGNSRCVSMQGRSMAVIDSWLGECHAKGNDAQGICVWSGAGPFLIENNRIEGSGQAIMFGGADPAIKDVVPSDIIVRHNYFFKPLSWNNKWTIKATFELKNARRVIFEGNVLENHWADAQVGFAILFQSVNQDRSAPWSTVTDVLVQNNVIKNSTGGVNLLARFSPEIVTPTSRILIRNNFFQDVGHDPFTGLNGRIFQILGELQDVTFANNTATTTGIASHAVFFDGNPGGPHDHSQQCVSGNDVWHLRKRILYWNTVTERIRTTGCRHRKCLSGAACRVISGEQLFSGVSQPWWRDSAIVRRCLRCQPRMGRTVEPPDHRRNRMCVTGAGYRQHRRTNALTPAYIRKCFTPKVYPVLQLPTLVLYRYRHSLRL